MHTISRQFIRYSAAGAIGTAAHYGVLILLVQLLLASPVIASFFGATIGALVNYGLNYRYTFRSTEAHRSTMPKYFFIAATAVIINTLLMSLFVTSLGQPWLPAQVVTTLLVLVWTFLVNRAWTFRHKHDA